MRLTVAYYRHASRPGALNVLLGEERWPARSREHHGFSLARRLYERPATAEERVEIEGCPRTLMRIYEDRASLMDDERRVLVSDPDQHLRGLEVALIVDERRQRLALKDHGGRREPAPVSDGRSRRAVLHLREGA